MLKPKNLRPGDTVALVSLSAGMAGDAPFVHKVELAKRRLKSEFDLNVVIMPNAMKGSDFLDKNPGARAADLMQAFADSGIQAVICMVGGDDTIRLLPHIDFDVLRRNPKIFMGYSDTTINHHFMLYKAGVMSYYGPCVLAEFAENAAMHDYTKNYIRQVLFQPPETLPIPPSPTWTSEFLDWADPKYDDTPRTMQPNEGYQLLQGSGIARGALVGGCIDVFSMIVGTELWPDAEHWNDKILFLETSEEYPTPSTVKYFLRGLMAQGILGRISGMLVGKPRDEKFYAEYRDAFIQVAGEAGRPDLPILSNMNFGHASPICVLPYGVMAEIDCAQKSFRLLEPGTQPA